MKKAVLGLAALTLFAVGSSVKVEATDATWYCNGRLINYDDGNDMWAPFHGDQWPVDNARFYGEDDNLRTHHETYANYFQSHAGHTLCS